MRVLRILAMIVVIGIACNILYGMERPIRKWVMLGTPSWAQRRLLILNALYVAFCVWVAQTLWSWI